MKALWLKFLDWFSERFGIGRTPIPREPVQIRPIGIVRNGVKTPRPDGWAAVRSDIIIRDDLVEMLDGIDGYSHLIVLFAFDRVPASELRARLRIGHDARIPEQGVLATRSQLRPSATGISVVKLLRRRATSCASRASTRSTGRRCSTSSRTSRTTTRCRTRPCRSGRGRWSERRASRIAARAGLKRARLS